MYVIFDRWCRYNGIESAHASESHIARWLQERRHLAPSTIRNSIIALRSLYRSLIASGVRSDNPVAHLRGPKVHLPPVDPFKDSDLLALLAATKTRRDRAMLLVFLGSGMRRSELWNIREEDIDWEKRTIRVNGKGDKLRLVAPGAVAMAALRDYLESRRGNIWQEGLASPDALNKWLGRISRRAGLPRVNLHRFRHTFASRFLELGGQEGQLQKILGHSTLAMSLHYAEGVRGKVALEAQRRLNPADQLRG